ncbi:MAG: outer membrane lipoprotein-sorting protein [Panacagrimonas sp.]
MRIATRILLILFALACTGAMEVSTQTPVVKVLECMRRNAPQALRIDDLRIEASGPQVSTRSLSARLLSRRNEQGLRLMLHVTAPADLAGTRYLLIENQPDDALYLYLPALGKVRRVSGAGPEAEIAGTTLHYSDMRLIRQALSAASINLERPIEFAGRPADLLRFVPAVADSPYRRVFATVDRETCVMLRAEFHDAERAIRDYRIDPASLMRSGSYHYASRASIEDRALGSTVQIALGGVRTDAKLSARLFDPKNFFKLD